jgi:hypothetical protein
VFIIGMKMKGNGIPKRTCHGFIRNNEVTPGPGCKNTPPRNKWRPHFSAPARRAQGQEEKKKRGENLSFFSPLFPSGTISPRDGK